MAKITRVEQAVPTIKTKKKVAAYARISMEIGTHEPFPLRTDQLLQFPDTKES